jgi:hypothetical protein
MSPPITVLSERVAPQSRERFGPKARVTVARRSSAFSGVVDGANVTCSVTRYSAFAVIPLMIVVVLGWNAHDRFSSGSVCWESSTSPWVLSSPRV